jgi:hypothetical protein
MEGLNKITASQLETIVAQQKDLSALLTNIGALEAQKHAFLHQLKETNDIVENFKSELQAEYGAININLEDGSYTLIEEASEVVG